MPHGKNHYQPCLPRLLKISKQSELRVWASESTRKEGHNELRPSILSIQIKIDCYREHEQRCQASSLDGLSKRKKLLISPLFLCSFHRNTRFLSLNVFNDCSQFT